MAVRYFYTTKCLIAYARPEFAALPLMGTMTVMMIRMNTYLILGPEAGKVHIANFDS